MISVDDLTTQRQVYTRNGKGRWAVLTYCPSPSVTMTNLDSGERLNFGLTGSYNLDFEPIPGVSHDRSAILVEHRQGTEFNRAIDFAVELGAEAAHFLRDWREGDTSGWPDFKSAELSA